MGGNYKVLLDETGNFWVPDMDNYGTYYHIQGGPGPSLTLEEISHATGVDVFVFSHQVARASESYGG